MQQNPRTAWVKVHLSWSSEDLEQVIFSDESTFTIQNHTGNNHVQRRPHEAFSSLCIMPIIKHSSSVMIWGCMTSHGIGSLHICEGMIKATKHADVLETKLLLSARSLFGEGN